MAQYLNYVQENMKPIMFQQVAKGQAGTNITTGERAFGIRHAPAAIEKPEQLNQGIEKANKKAADEAKRFRERMKQ
jgi:hypothetical protein